MVETVVVAAGSATGPPVPAVDARSTVSGYVEPPTSTPSWSGPAVPGERGRELVLVREPADEGIDRAHARRVTREHREAVALQHLGRSRVEHDGLGGDRVDVVLAVQRDARVGGEQQRARQQRWRSEPDRGLDDGPVDLGLTADGELPEGGECTRPVRGGVDDHERGHGGEQPHVRARLEALRGARPPRLARGRRPPERSSSTCRGSWPPSVKTGAPG